VVPLPSGAAEKASNESDHGREARRRRREEKKTLGLPGTRGKTSLREFSGEGHHQGRKKKKKRKKEQADVEKRRDPTQRSSSPQGISFKKEKKTVCDQQKKKTFGGDKTRRGGRLHMKGTTTSKALGQADTRGFRSPLGPRGDGGEKIQSAP